jgi:hypothetical protein
MLCVYKNLLTTRQGGVSEEDIDSCSNAESGHHILSVTCSCHEVLVKFERLISFKVSHLPPLRWLFASMVMIDVQMVAIMQKKLELSMQILDASH